jgi:ribonuclease HI
MIEQKKKDQVMAVRSLIKRLLVYGKGRRQEEKLLDKEEQEWQGKVSTSQPENEEESCTEELDKAIQMAECVYDIDEPDGLPENPELVEFLCAEPDKPPPEVQDPLEVIDLGTEEDPRPIQISGLLRIEDRAKIISLLQEFKDCFAWHYTEMPGLDPALVEHRMPIKEGYKPVKQAPRRMSKEIEEKVKEEIERLVKAGFIRPAKYVEWLANIVPVLKAITKAVRCCVDYRNINSATPKDEYPMPMADLSIDAVAKHKVLSFMDGNAGYNQIKIAPEDIHKTAFRCPGHVGAYEYLVMPFGLKNAGATYQRAMNAIFHDLIGQSMEVYIDDIVVKSKTEEQHLVDLKQALMKMRIHKLKMNPKKCAFGVRAGNFLGFLVHQRGVEVDKNKSRAILESLPPTNKVQLQRLLGKINFLRRFIANLAGKIQPLTPLLRLKDRENFEWGPTHQQAFDSIKAYLTSPPVLVPPQRGKPLKLYISASERSIGSLLAQNNEGGKEQAVYYLSRILTEVETRYSPVEKLCLALYFTASKLRHYMLPCHVHIIAKTDVIKYMLSRPMLAGRIGKWILALSEFSFQYIPQRAVKGQAIADFLTEHQESQSEEINIPGSLEVANVWIPPRSDVSGKEDWIQQEIRRVTGLWITPWKLYFDGSHTQKAAGSGIVIINPQGVYHYYSFLLDYQENTNNRAEYEALIIGLEILLDLGAAEVEVFGDSELVINQLNGEFKCRHITMAGYYMAATQLLSFWESEISVNHIPRGSNLAANEMAQLASGVPIQERKYGIDVEIQTRNLPSILDRGFSLDVMVLETKMEDWRAPIIHHLKDPSSPTSKKNRQQATKYVLWAKNLLRKTPDGLLLKCLGQEESMRVMAEVHEGICGAH